MRLTAAERLEQDRQVGIAIREGQTKFAGIHRAIACACGGGMPFCRVLDQSLQRLRRAGKIYYSADGLWRWDA